MDEQTARMGIVVLFSLIFLFAFFYFLPSLVAIIRKHNNKLAIEALNLFLGWTLIGWVVALVWACTKDVNKTETTNPNPQKLESIEGDSFTSPVDTETKDETAKKLLLVVLGFVSFVLFNKFVLGR